MTSFRNRCRYWAQAGPAKEIAFRPLSIGARLRHVFGLGSVECHRAGCAAGKIRQIQE